jgi:hypothetical protein
LLPGPTSQDHIPCRHGGSRQSFDATADILDEHGRDRLHQPGDLVALSKPLTPFRPDANAARNVQQLQAHGHPMPAINAAPQHVIRRRVARFGPPMRQPIVVEEHPRLLRRQVVQIPSQVSDNIFRDSLSRKLTYVGTIEAPQWQYQN